jgi:hypothetical protein
LWEYILKAELSFLRTMASFLRTMATNEITHGAANCYFCLDNVSDEEGNLPVRDCSCRGDSAGFAHLSCLAKYAEQKCKEGLKDDGDTGLAFCKPWNFCNTCKQPFQNQLAVDLASAFVSFTEATYGQEGNSKWDKLKIMTAFRSKIEVLYTTSPDEEMMRVEVTKLINMIDRTKEDLNMRGWVHMPHSSEEYQYYKVLLGNYEANAHIQFGVTLMGDKTEESHRLAITHFKKASAIFRLVGMKDDATAMDNKISRYPAFFKPAEEGTSSILQYSKATSSSILQDSRNNYEQKLKTWGMESEHTIQRGLHYVRALGGSRHFIEGERLATKLATICRQIHGPHHKTTIKANEILESCKRRCVIVLPDDKLFQALRYENDGETCVVYGPILEPRIIQDESIHHIANTRVIPICPVMCNGIVSPLHLNGELGEVRSYKQDGNGKFQLEVCFEKRGKKAMVKPENLRIAFDLPSEDSRQ